MAQKKRPRGRTMLDILASQSKSQEELDHHTNTQTTEQVQPHPHTRSRAQVQVQPQSQTQSQAQTQTQAQAQAQTHSTGTGSHVEASQSTHIDGTSTTGSTSTRRRGRGIAKGLETWGTDQKLHLEFNDLGQPIGKSGTHLSTHIGIMVRNGEQVPLHYARWDDMPEHALDYIWTEVKDNTDAPPEFRDDCLKIAGALWRRWKGQVKQDYYIKYETDEQCLLNRPDRVQPDQWDALVAYWRNEKTQEMARINKRNREHQVLNHTTGRKKHAQVRIDMEASGKETDRINVFIETRKPKDGRPQAPETAAAIAEMTSRLDTVSEEERTLSFKEKVFTEVIGPDVRGRVKTYGAGATQSNVFGIGARTSTTSKEMEMEQRIVEKVSALFDSRIAEMVDLFRAGLARESRRGEDGPSSIGQVPTLSSVHRPDYEAHEDSFPNDEVMERD